MSQPGRKIILLAIVAVSALLSLVGAFILTDAGQIFDISKEVVIGYFRVHRNLSTPMRHSFIRFIEQFLLSLMFRVG